jgi:cholesterol oxidase
MTRLARPASDLQCRYDAVVIGSGYGGGVAASRLARMGLGVAVLERGREILPADFPSTLDGLRRELQKISGGMRSGAPDGLFELRVSSDATVLSGCGLGGTSLISAGVCLSPDMLVLDDPCWPDALRTDHYLGVGFHRARTMLLPETLPAREEPPKPGVLDCAAAAMGRSVDPLPLHIAFTPRVTPSGDRQPACSFCGNCLTGCNLGAKTTVHSTYLADAARHGAQLFTNAHVRYVEPDGQDGWRVAFRLTSREAGPMPLRSIAARHVFIAAGTLGSIDILQRSRARGLALSDRLGAAISMNGAIAAFTPDGGGPGERQPARQRPGPISTGMIDLRRRRVAAERLVITDGVIPGMLRSLMQGVIAEAAGPRADRTSATGLEDRPGADVGSPLATTQILFALANDAAGGRATVDGDEISLHPPSRTTVEAAGGEDVLQALAQVSGARFAPLAQAFGSLAGGGPLTLFPIGGAAMSDERSSGVVDHKGRVFDADERKSGDAVHRGLFVVDGSVMPRSLGVHPLLTITAVAERSLLLFARDNALALDVGEPERVAEKPSAPPPARSLWSALARRGG